MKKILVITGIFNDVFTNYEDKESSVSIIVDPEVDCKCTEEKKCWLCKNIEKFGLKDYVPKPELTQAEVLNNAMKKIKDQKDIDKYYLTESWEESDEIVKKIFNELPADIYNTEVLALRQAFKTKAQHDLLG
jgi:hypothetical protein